MRRWLWRVPLVVLVAAPGAGCDRQANPAAPASAPAAAMTPSVQAVIVTGAPGAGPLRVGETVQFRATAQMADGSLADVSELATWSSDNASVASVTKSGLVTAGDPGTSNITARYQLATGLFPVVVSAPDATVPVTGAPSAAGPTPPGNTPVPPPGNTPAPPPGGTSPTPNPPPQNPPGQPCQFPVTLPEPLPPCPSLPPLPNPRG